MIICILQQADELSKNVHHIRCICHRYFISIYSYEEKERKKKFLQANKFSVTFTFSHYALEIVRDIKNHYCFCFSGIIH